MIIRLLICLCLLEFSKTQSIASTSSRVISLKVPESFKFIYNQTAQVLKQLHLTSFVNLDFQKCAEGVICDHLRIIESNSKLNEQIILPASTTRIKQSILQHLSKYLQPDKRQISQDKVGKDAKLTRNKLKLVEITKLPVILKKDQEDDWDRAHVFETKAQLAFKQKPKIQEQFDDQQMKHPVMSKTIKSKSKISAQLSRQPNQVYKWYLVYFILSAIVILGMKYMNQEEERINQETLQMRDCPHYCSQQEQI